MSKWKIEENIPGWWIVYRSFPTAEPEFHHFPSGAEAIAAFARGGR